MVENIPEELSGMFVESNEIDIKQKIVEELLNDNNLSRKTELVKPITWAILDSIRTTLKKHKLEKSAKIIEEFIDTSMKNLISKDRKGRLEYIEALKNFTPMISQNPFTDKSLMQK